MHECIFNYGDCQSEIDVREAKKFETEDKGVSCAPRSIIVIIALIVWTMFVLLPLLIGTTICYKGGRNCLLSRCC